MEYVLLAILLVCALVIVVAVIFQKSGEKGLSGTIAGNSETYYGKDKTGGRDKMLFKWTLIASIVFAVAVVVVYVIQPDYTKGYDVDAWQTLSQFASIFK
ncbi:MAG: preprotein translocase subunit SecG [Clostridia bacterium]|nr:preprotein translocase subunit SecG [Clostridia bacterium]